MLIEEKMDGSQITKMFIHIWSYDKLFYIWMIVFLVFHALQPYNLSLLINFQKKLQKRSHPLTTVSPTGSPTGSSTG